MSTKPGQLQFFARGNGWDHRACTACQGVRSRTGSFADQRDVNLAIRCDLLKRGLAHGILVYAKGAPVGWCQFGPRCNLPIPRKTELSLGDAALQAIRKRCGDVVLSHPIVTSPNDAGLDALVRVHGGGAAEVLRYAKERFGATEVVAYDRRAFPAGGVFVHELGPSGPPSRG